MLKFATVASGSSGNCSVITDGSTHILIDAGVSARRITTGLKQLGLEPGALSAVLITHEHSDHISGIPVLCRQLGVELYTAEETAREICRKNPELQPRFRVFEPGERFALRDLVVGTFPVSHDCVSPVGYTVTQGERKLTFCTDLGVVTQPVLEAVQGASTLVAEFNYDPEMLRTGPYPAYLKSRIAGQRGHLSNQVGAKLTRWAVERGTRQVVLAHLSKENNLPATAQRAAQESMPEGMEHIALRVAPRSEASDWMEV
ncbi:MAG TPA: MBL fold metallo-hydrolase [Candidatus Enterenecus avicola]|nr:MBL fold metallo-hydrolase [Candidatus Enterenecus avicola]